MKVHLRYFASIRETLGRDAETLDTEATTLGALRDALIAQGGVYAVALSRGKPLRMALNQTLSREDALLGEGAEVAFFPPVTGG